MPYCAVCHKAGQPESVYTSHFVRQTPHKDSPVLPARSQQRMQILHETGHFASGCPLLRKEARDAARNNVTEKAQVSTRRSASQRRTKGKTFIQESI